MPLGFFDQSKEQSEIKSTIVRKYFVAWTNVILAVQRKTNRKSPLFYVDLFCGPGQFRDGIESTPLLVLRNAIKNPQLHSRLIAIFNDAEPENVRLLKQAIESLPNIDKLKHFPRFLNIEVNEDLAQIFARFDPGPTILFADPWGYKGLSRALINSVLKRWGSDCIIFFNYNRINAALENDFMRKHMDALFGHERVESLRIQFSFIPNDERESTVIESMFEALLEIQKALVLPFRFKNEQGTRTSHHLIFVTKNFKGYEIMKSIMARESSTFEQGVPSFEYNQASERQPLLFELARPIEDLAQMLTNDFSGRVITMRKIYEEHSVGKPFLESNYKKALGNLENLGKIKVEPPFTKRRRLPDGTVSFGPNVLVSFPLRSS